MNADRPALIETLRSDMGGNIPLLSRHLRRLQKSAQQLNYLCPLEEIEHSLLKEARQYQSIKGRLRLLLYCDGTFDLTSVRLPWYPRKLLYIVLAEPYLQIPNVWLQHKTTHRPDYYRARCWLKSHPSYFDCIFLNQYQQVCEGSRSTIYLKLDGHWYTPPLTCGVLPGIMREILLESGQVRERILSVDELFTASQWRISNALYGWRDALLDRNVIALQ